jgi:DNA replication protein DnaC
VSKYVFGKPGVGKTYWLKHKMQDNITNDYEQYVKYLKVKGTYLDYEGAPKFYRGIVGRNHSFVRIRDIDFRNRQNWKSDNKVSTGKQSAMTIKNLYIDDLGTEKNDVHVLELMQDIFEARFDNKLETYITSNLSMAQLRERWNRVDTIMTERIMSRLKGLVGQQQEMKGEDRRWKQSNTEN